MNKHGCRLLFACVWLISCSACQFQTRSIPLCDPLQIQGDDATCWLRNDLDPIGMVAPQILYGIGDEPLEGVLKRIGLERKIPISNGVEFENDVSTFTIRCKPNSERSGGCAWSLISRPRGRMDDVLSAELLAATKWLQSHNDSNGPLRLALLEKNSVNRSFFLDIENDMVVIEWVDSEARLNP